MKMTIRYCITIIGLMILSVVTNAATAVEQEETIFHPKMFNLLQNWISDTENTVVTEINLDAIEKNRNEYNFKAIKRHNKEWYRYDNPEDGDYYLYKVISHYQGRYKIIFREAGSDSFSIAYEIIFEVTLLNYSRVLHA